jgi:hypothetical protein
MATSAAKYDILYIRHEIYVRVTSKQAYTHDLCVYLNSPYGTRERFDY